MPSAFDRIHRAPLGFGPAPSPRQGPDGSRFTSWSDARTTTIGVVLEVDRDSIDALLPEGYSVDPSTVHPTILLEVMELRNLPWLAGRGYNTFGIYLNDVVCNRVAPPIKASYLAVLFENFTDPITTGREELGFPKVFAEIPDPVITYKDDGKSGDEDKRIHTVSWDGYEFLRLELSNLACRPSESSPALCPAQQLYTHPTKNGILHQRYIPSVGEPGKADANYATFCPPAPSRPTVLQFKTLDSTMTDVANTVCPAVMQSMVETTAQGVSEFCHGAAKVEIRKGSFEQLPTLHNIVDRLAALKFSVCHQIAVQEFKGASDLGELPECVKIDNREITTFDHSLSLLSHYSLFLSVSHSYVHAIRCTTANNHRIEM
ncbi:uncharacterized protein UTRI_03011 [Ustilago trichophora]|uniref:Uncharacterized protein n=1 Tax=Ustilago trichophora TaxID=86804 RepID=A0A5C3E7T5_9BASI|nr:uncharacterized protein UTRI_03011 [Ustilago trichophora]